ncbi:carbohydrate kinase family protein [Pusillimonas sp. TS35]|uniref:carbohydrate kinase family protein n=1 Tax=Paracandidimonas lactea TaxID=2895524 RepID=UPI00136DC7F5|nr:carbohydrate kinase family protein [Paracandidimonas lactea]MYN14088.1 carbohydrate kinase family protein [Pusillimonas sp. TS35]
MTDRVLICGSIAFDTIAVFEGRFKEHFLPDSIQSLSVSFFVPTLRKEYGGCAGNIAYNLRLLGGNPVPVGMVGADAADYLERMRSMGIDTSMVRMLDDMYTPQCFITTDLDDNQIASFHPGAMIRSAENDLTGQKAVWGIVAPDAKDGMFAHARRLKAQGIPFVFDLGQAMPLFNGDELNEMLGMADVFTANNYEASVVEKRTGRSIQQIADTLRAAVVTQGAKGATLYAHGKVTHVPPVLPEQVLDPTGCGDAHRAGLLYGLTQNWSMLDACRLANLMGSFKIAAKGPQNHNPSRADINTALQQHYGISLAGF